MNIRQQEDYETNIPIRDFREYRVILTGKNTKKVLIVLKAAGCVWRSGREINVNENDRDIKQLCIDKRKEISWCGGMCRDCNNGPCRCREYKERNIL